MSNRIISPHISIYKPQITWILSIGHRITGAFVGVLLYSTAIAYAINSTRTEETVIKIIGTSESNNTVSKRNAIKTVIATPVLFHTFNGIRHLVSFCVYY